MSDIFREIDEDLRRENFAKLWTKYGSYVVALAVLVVLITAGVVGWREWQNRQRMALGVRYEAALDLSRSGKDADAAAAFGAIAKDSGGGRGMLARFEEAGLRIKQGDVPGAVALYDELSQDGSVEPMYRGIATLLAARYTIDGKDPAAAVAKLQPLTDGESPWKSSALELTALAQLKAGDKTAARDTYRKLADDLTATQGARGRAAEMVAALGQ